ncbi:hypothetical protein G5V57_18100 [Nordella sp. HKS 07]|uniref:hypothetical protein n=1 Tax=Nordella sp. HKS 07 TaxID=2712222 RepID=UPI0013E1FCBB|nr:hypothetical protein [Nordella sp. HKS 07]QIG49459.1 hypothetical protein G5V57_18100 [Nordella sp. HKS 07]
MRKLMAVVVFSLCGATAAHADFEVCSKKAGLRIIQYSSSDYRIVPIDFPLPNREWTMEDVEKFDRASKPLRDGEDLPNGGYKLDGYIYKPCHH